MSRFWEMEMTKRVSESSCINPSPLSPPISLIPLLTHQVEWSRNRAGVGHR
jgi:hypothetical protein